MKKVIISLVTVALLLVMITGCSMSQPSSSASESSNPSQSQQAASSAETSAESGKVLRFMLSNPYYTAPYCTAYNAAAQEKANELGVELTILDGQGNQQTQLEQANTAISDKYDGFIYMPADIDGAAPIIEKLNSSGIAWMGTCTYDGTKCEQDGIKYYEGPDSKSHGITMANYILQAFPDGAKLVAIEGTAGHNQTIQINAAFGELLNSNYEFIDKQDCDFKPELAMTKMTDMLTAYGLASKGGEIDCIVSHDGGMLTGIISALESAGYKPGDVKIVACGSNMVVYDALKDGWLSATSTQDPMYEGAFVVQMMYDIINDPASVQTGWIKMETPLATPDNADEFNWF